MYDRILKRPMFRIGGQAGQGTGIMSHVEPKPRYAVGGRIMAQGGYNPLQIEYTPRSQIGYTPAIGYTPQTQSAPGMFDPYATTGTATEAEKVSAFENSYEKMRQKRIQDLEKLRKFGSMGKASEALGGISGYLGLGAWGPSALAIAPFYGMANAAPLTGEEKRKQDEAEKLQQQYFGKGRRDIMADIQAGRKTEAVSPYKDMYGMEINKNPANYKETNPAGSLLAYKNLTSPGTITTAIDENGNLIDRSTGQLLDREPGQTDKTTVPSKPVPKDPKQQIKEEADFIRDLVKDEDMTTAEAAFVVARALATPGGIGEKVKAANELLIPMAKEKSKTKKDITLEAYKAYKDKQLEEIKAGKLSDWGKAAREAAENAKLAGDKRPIEEIIKEYNDLKFGEEKFMDKIIAGSKIKELDIIVGKIKSIREVEDRIQNNEKVDKDEKKLYEKNKKEVERFKLENPEIFKKYYGAKDGGRIGFAYGSPEPEQQPQVESTTLDQGNNETQLKPVVKLSYQELRARLPKEISDNIILLLSNSDQALQDFAYIATQQDINDFNVKYGVNLILPSNK